MEDLICVSCGNQEYFETEVETVKEITPNGSAFLVGNAVFDDWDHSESSLRANLDDMIGYVFNNGCDVLTFDPVTKSYYNQHIQCARCGGARVTPRLSKWSPVMHKSLDDEILANRKDYQQLRKERNRENKLPVLYRQQTLPPASLGSGNIQIQS